MARPPRMEYPGAWYHIMSRGAKKGRIFHNDIQRQLFRQLLGEMHTLFGVRVHAYCMMDDHYHLLLCTPRGNLSRCMRQLNGVYTQRFNNMMQRHGVLFHDRFKAILLDAERYALAVSRYIHLTPTRADLDINLHTWSSYLAYTGRNQPMPWLNMNAILKQLDKSTAAYEKYMCEEPDKLITHFYGKKHLSPILGHSAFQVDARMRAAQHRAQLRRFGVPLLESTPSIAHIMQTTADYYQVPLTDLHVPQRRKGNPPRLVAMALCREVGGHPLKAIAEALKNITHTGVSAALRRAQTASQRSPAMRDAMEAIKQRLLRPENTRET